MSNTVPKTMKALKCFGPKDVRVVDDAPVPECPSDYMLVKVEAIALNPTDWKHCDWLAQPGYHHTVGCDYAGTVIKPAAASSTKSFKPGDRVSGYVHGSKHEDPLAGCFAQYAKVKADIQIHIPSNITFEEAATWPTGINTVGQGMYSHDGLQLPWPDKPTKEEIKVLIYGASTNTGLWAVQFAKLSGLYVIATCSEKNFEAVRGLGADEVSDYREEGCGERIREATRDGLVYAFDCVSEGNSKDICAAALTSKPNVARYGALLPIELPREDVKTSFTIGYTVIGEEFTFFGNKVPAKPEDLEFGRKWWALSERLLAEGKIKGEPTIRDGGLNGVVEGFEDMKEGRVSRQKLVYRVGDTS